jgi:hypothetical protein
MEQLCIGDDDNVQGKDIIKFYMMMNGQGHWNGMMVQVIWVYSVVRIFVGWLVVEG